MTLERASLVVVAVALALGGATAVLPGAFPAGPLPVSPATVLGWTLWATTGLFAAVTLLWTALTYVVGAGYAPPEPVHGGDDVQVRILTVDAESVVQGTVDSLPDELDDVRVIAEEPIDVAGAAVHAVPDGFECEAVRKGRAIEWARRRVPCDREYVLYLDEDSVMTRFGGLPDADVVQLRERPRRTGSRLSYLADVYRMGVQLEQRAFARLSIPLFAWGGGIAVRRRLEDGVTWDRETLVEDTAFVWAAARDRDVDFELADVVCRNEAPPGLYEILQQRRRWAAGNLRAAGMLPLPYRLLSRVRNYAWALSPVVTLVAIPMSALGIAVASTAAFAAVSAALALFTLFWFLRGVAYYGDRAAPLALAAPLVPVVAVVHSMGTIAGILSPPGEFRVTEKVGTR